MKRLLELTNNELFRMFIGDKPLRVYKTEVDGRLGIPGLSKLVLKVTAKPLNEAHAYVFCIKNQNAVKILTRDIGSTSMIEVYDEHAIGIKQECKAFGLL